MSDITSDRSGSDGTASERQASEGRPSRGRGLIFRLISSTLLVTSFLVTLLLVVVGYQIALWILESGKTQGQTAMVVLGVTPSLCALLSLPFWLTLRRLNRNA